MSIITLKNVCKSYQVGKVTEQILLNINLELNGSKFFCISGPSGSGKSTLLNIIAGLEKPDSGEVKFNDENIYDYREKEMNHYHRSTIGFVFQFYNLIPNLTLYENILLAADLVKKPLPINDVINFIGLSGKENQFPDTLSGGEQQRVAMARAIVKNPDVILCDEPTGALDSRSGLLVLELLQKLRNDYNKSVIVVTHNSSILNIGEEIINLKDGKITQVEKNNPVKLSEVHW